MEKLTKKILEDKLNKGWTTKQFTEYYEMTEKEFLLSIEKLSSVKNYIDSIKRRLNKNDKKFRQTISSSDIDTSSIEEVEIKTEKNISTSFTETDSGSDTIFLIIVSVNVTKFIIYLVLTHDILS